MTIIIIAISLILLWFILTYNNFISLQNRVENSWSQIEVQLKRRADLIPNLIETVKGYMKHEKTVLTEITRARTELMKAKTISQKADADNKLASTLKTLFAVAENYPKLRANENFKMLQEELAGTENKIAYARQFYNDSVMILNTKIKQFPSNIIARIMKLKKKDYFNAEPSERKSIKVRF